MDPQKQQQKQTQKRRRRPLTIFWEGTANTLDPLTTQIGLFSEACCATPVTASSNNNYDVVVPTEGPLKLSFDGCGVTNGNWGVLFASGLDGQVNVAVQIVETMLQQQQQQDTPQQNDEQGVHVVAVGLSRGGMACMKLAQKLANTFPNTTSHARQPPPRVTASLLLFDPVPGNAVSTGFPWTACWSQDLSQCHNLQRVLALYPYEALPDLAMHAPTLCRYNPATTLVQEDVTLGCHQGALFMPRRSPRNPYEQASNLSVRRILDYLTYEGVHCRLPSALHVPSPDDCIQLMDRVLSRQTSHTEALRRKTHDQTGHHRAILRHTTASSCRWLNRHHEQLANARQRGESTATRAAVFGEQNQNDVTTSHPQTQQPTNRLYQLDFDDGYVTCTSRFL